MVMILVGWNKNPKTLQEKLDETARAVEPVLWEILNEIEGNDE
jgi:hypothetical protein